MIFEWKIIDKIRLFMVSDTLRKCLNVVKFAERFEHFLDFEILKLAFLRKIISGKLWGML